MRELKEQTLATSSRKFIRPEEVVWVVVGDLRKVESGIRELGFGEVMRLDADGRPME